MPPRVVFGIVLTARLACALLISLGSLCAQPLDVMLVLETSLGTERTTGLIHPRVLREDDRAGLIGFHRTAVLLQPLTADREELAAALQRSGARAGIIVGGRGSEPLNSNPAVDLVAALKEACREFGRLESNERKRAVVVFFAGEDPNLTAQLVALGTALSMANARLYGVVVQRVDAPGPPGIPRTGPAQLPAPAPLMTARLLSQLAEESGGRIFRRNWDLKEILAEARKP